MDIPALRPSHAWAKIASLAWSGGKRRLRGWEYIARLARAGPGDKESSQRRGPGNMVNAAVNFTGYDLASLVQLFSLIVLPFAHEDLAIVLGAYIVVNDLMPVGLVAASIYGGIVVSDFALY